jgi:lipopolysaccharide transport system permease protein
MSIQASTSVSLHSREVPLNIFAYLWEALRHYALIGVVGAYLLRNTYQRTVLGPFWLFVQCILPVAGMIAVFNHVNSFQTSAIPYPLFLISGMGLWTILDVGLKRGLRNLNYAKKLRKVVHAPRIAMTIAGLSIPLFHHVIFFVFLLGSAVFMWFTTGHLSILVGFNLIYVLVSVLLTCMLVVGISAVLSVIFLMSRDIRHVIAAIIQAWFFVTPVVYPLEILPDRLRWFSEYGNPMTSIVEMYRYGLFGGPEPQTFIVSAAVTLCIFLFGVWFMMRSDWILDEVL